MLTRITAARLDERSLFGALHPELRRWFKRRFKHFSPAQLLAVPEILAGQTTLLSSPTGSGKTLAAFTAVFDRLIRKKEAGELTHGIVAVYTSPLRALAYDLQKNLQRPLEELGWDFVRVASRTGDTTSAERAAQKRKPPHILVTTPESLTLLLSQPAWTPVFRETEFFIVDELHALAENKRGALLMVAAERLEQIRLPERPLVRIGLSATVSPLERVAEYLAGRERPCQIIEVTQRKPARIEVFSPLRGNPYPPAGYTATRVLEELTATLKAKRTTLVFTNTRSGAETIGLQLKRILAKEADKIEVHHASLDRAVRLEVEDRLKRGELRAVVCSTSLEMGIDIGSIDLVVMVSAPKGVARALQRIGRSGHSMGETSHGLLVASNINDLAECAVTAKMMELRELEEVRIQENPRDVLAQHLVGIAIAGNTTGDQAFELVRRSYPFRNLTQRLFDQVLRYLQGGGASLEKQYRDQFGKVVIDEEGILRVPSERVARSFYQNVGTIAAETMVQVRTRARNIGQVEEGFMARMRIGDIFVLNGRTLRLVEAKMLTAKVVEAKNELPTVPRWNANKMPLASGLASEVVNLRTQVAARLDTEGAAENWLVEEYRLTHSNAVALVRHFRLQAEVSCIPTEGNFLIECYREGDYRHYFFHSLIGRAANDSLSRITAQRVQELRGGNALATIDDYGFLLSLKEFQALDLKSARLLFCREGAEEALRAALAEAPLVKGRFRGVLQTGLMVPRRVHGEQRGARALQWSSEVLFDVLRRHEPDHPLLEEAYIESTLRFLDTPRALRFLESAAELQWDFREVEKVSPFSFGMYVSKIKESMTLEDRETTIERLYHQMYGEKQASSP